MVGVLGTGPNLSLNPKCLLNCTPERHVDLGVEEDEEGEGDDAEADEPEPVEVDRVVDVPPQLRRQDDRVALRICKMNH